MSDELSVALHEMLNSQRKPPTQNLLVIREPPSPDFTELYDFYDQYGRTYLTNDDTELVIPVIYLKSPLALDERALYVTILLKIDILIDTGAPVSQLRNRTVDLMRQYKVKMLIVDYAGWLLISTKAKEEKIIKFLKFINESLQISIVLHGGIFLIEDLRRRHRQFADSFNVLHLGEFWSHCGDC